MDVEGKSVLVTGAGAGIGRAVAVMFAQRGAARVVLVDIDARSLAASAEAVRAAGARAIALTADLSKPEEVIAVFEEADRETGGLDIVHNNAGIMTGRRISRTR